MGRRGDDQIEELVLVRGVVVDQALLERRPELGPELDVVLALLALHLVEGGEHLLDELLLDHLDLAILLQDLAGHVERQVVGIDHALDEPQVRRHQLLALVHHEHALDVELDAALHLGAVQVERRLARQVEQCVRLDRALHAHGDAAQWIGPVVGDVLVELLVLVVGDLALGAVPDRLHRVERLVAELDRVRDEVRVALHDVAEHLLVGVVAHAVLGVDRAQVQRDRRACLGALALPDRVRAVARGLPLGRGGGAGLAGGQRDLGGDHERRVEADAELADQVGHRGLRVARAGRLDGGLELLGPRLRDRADVLDHLLAGHPDPAVVDGEGAGLGAGLEPDAERAGGGQLGAGELLEPELVERIGGVRDQLAEEHLLVRIEGVDHQVEELGDLGLELVTLGLRHQGQP